MAQLRVGVVGLGRLADSIHLPTLASLPDVDLVAAADLDERRRRAAAEKFGIPQSFADHRAMIEQAGLDAVLVATTPHAVGQVGIDTLGAGLATFLEKPPGLTGAETRALRAAAERSGALAMVGFNRRFQPLVREAKRQVEELGPVVSVLVEFHPFDFEHYRRAGFSEHNLRHFHAAQSVHAVDLLRYLGGEVAAVYGQVGNYLSDYGDTFSALVEFSNGATGHVICNYTSPTRIERAEIHGRGALAVLEGVAPGERRSAYPFESAIVYRGDTVAELRNPTADDAVSGGYRQEVRYFLDCVRDGGRPERPAATLTDAVGTMELIDAILAGRRGPMQSAGAG
jgi:virulence factor